jgi:hypothetical protein
MSTHLQFVKAWESAACVREVAQRLKITEDSARSKAKYLRKLGFALKKFKTPMSDDEARAIRKALR